MHLVNIYGGVTTYFAGSHEEELPEIVFNNGVIEFVNDHDCGSGGNSKRTGKKGAYEDEESLRKNWDMFRDLGFEQVGTISVDTSKYGADRIVLTESNSKNKKKGSKEHIEDPEEPEEDLENEDLEASEAEKEKRDIERGLINIAGQSTGLVEAVPVAGLLSEFADDAVIAARALVVAAAHESAENESSEDMPEDTFDSFMADYPEEFSGSHEDELYEDIVQDNESFDDFFTAGDDEDHKEDRAEDRKEGGLGDSEKYDPDNFMYDRQEPCGCDSYGENEVHRLGGLDAYIDPVSDEVIDMVTEEHLLEAHNNCTTNGGKRCLGDVSNSDASHSGGSHFSDNYQGSFEVMTSENDYDEEYDFYD